MAKDDAGGTSRAYRDSAAFRRASFHSPEEIWGMFADADAFTEVVGSFAALVDSLSIDQDLHGIEFYEVLTSKLTFWKCQSLWDLLNLRVKSKIYKNENKPNNVARHFKCLVIGAGPIGLRTAIEMLMLGCRTVIVEKRTEFTRNNVLHLWPFLLTDFKALGAKKFYGKFGSGCIDHINIKNLQVVLLKVALVLGVEIFSGVEFKEYIEPTDGHGWRVKLHPVNHELSKSNIDIIIGADGKKNVLPGFPQIELRGSLAIGITCNFSNNNTPDETSAKEISGISYQFKPTFFDDLKAKYGVELENIVYYKDETHYFVMTARKASLLATGVISNDHSEPSALLNPTNINKTKLIEYTRNAVEFATTLPRVEFKKLSNGQPDIALFDFTSLKKAESASRIIERKKHKLMLGLVGDSLVEPFWPTGSGVGRGVLSALDVAWMVRQLALKSPPLSAIRERENVFKLLSASNNDSLQKNYDAYTIDPKTRYSALDTRTVANVEALKSLYDTDDLENADLTVNSPGLRPKCADKKRAAFEKQKSSGSVSRPSSKVGGKAKRRLERQASKETRNDDASKRLSVGDTRNIFENRYKSMGIDTSLTKKKTRTSSLEGIHEEGMPDLIMQEGPVNKNMPGARKRINSKEQAENPKGKVLKRQTSKELLRKPKQLQKGSKQKSLKRASSKEELESSTNSTEDAPASKRKVFQAKGGGLKSKAETRKLSEKSNRRSASLRKSLKKCEEDEDDVFDNEEAKLPEIVQIDSKTFFAKWLETLLPKLWLPNTPKPKTIEYPLETCAQSSVVSVMGIALLYDCNKPPKRRTTDLKLQELLANAKYDDVKNNSPENNPKKTHDVSSITTGSVSGVRAKYQKMSGQEGHADNYNDFLRTRKTESKTERDTVDGGKAQVTTEGGTAKDSCVEMDVVLKDEILVNQKKGRTQVGNSEMKTIINVCNNSEMQLQLVLEQFCDLQSPLHATMMLQVVYNIHKRIGDEPNIDKHYRIYTKGKIFNKYIWRLEGAHVYFFSTGWMLCGEFLIVSKSHPVHLIIKVIENVFRKNKRFHLLYRGSVKPELSSRGSLSKSNPKDKLLASYTDVDSPVDSDDSAIGSGVADDEEVIQKIQSQDQNMGDEAYVVIDFVNSDRNDVTRVSPNVAIPIATPCTVSTTTCDGEVAVEHSSPFTSVCIEDGDIVDDLEVDRSHGVSISGNRDELNSTRGGVPLEQKDNFEEITSVGIEGSDIVVGLEVDRSQGIIISEKHDDLNSTMENVPLQQKDNSEEKKKKKKKVFAAGKGLKNIDDSSEKRENRVILDKTKSDTDITRLVSTTPTLNQKAINDTIQRSAALERSSSSTSLGTPVNIVQQNKMMFDQQIACQLKRNVSSQELRTRSGSSGKGNVNAFERGKFESGSFKGSCDIDLTGKVSETRSLFAGGKQGSPSSPVITQNRKLSTRSRTSIDSSNSTTSTKEQTRGVIVNSEDKKHVAVVKGTTDAHKMELLGKNMESNCVETNNLSIIDPDAVNITKDRVKKKKFPFKKKKKEKLNDTKYMDNDHARNVDDESINDLSKERPVDVKVDLINDDTRSLTNAISSNVDRQLCDLNNIGTEPDDRDTVQTDPINNIPEQTQTTEVGISINLPTEGSKNHASEVLHANTLPVQDKIKFRKKKRLSKTRPRSSLTFSDSNSSEQDTIPISSDDDGMPPKNQDSNEASSQLVSGMIVNLITDDNNNDEELLTQTILANDVTSTISFDKLTGLDGGGDCNLETEVLATSPISNIVEVDIDSLQNETCIDDVADETSSSRRGSYCPVISVTDSDSQLGHAASLDIRLRGDNSYLTSKDNISDPDDDLVSMGCQSDISESLYDGDSIASQDLSTNINAIDNIENKKAKKKKTGFPFHIKLGKKKDKSKNEPMSDATKKTKLKDNIPAEDTCSETSKKKKSKNKDTLLQNGQKPPATSCETFSNSNSLSPTRQYGDSSTKDKIGTEEKVKSKKSPFFKKKKLQGGEPIQENTQSNTNGVALEHTTQHYPNRDTNGTREQLI